MGRIKYLLPEDGWEGGRRDREGNETFIMSFDIALTFEPCWSFIYFQKKSVRMGNNWNLILEMNKLNGIQNK